MNKLAFAFVTFCESNAKTLLTFISVPFIAIKSVIAAVVPTALPIWHKQGCLRCCNQGRHGRRHINATTILPQILGQTVFSPPLCFTSASARGEHSVRSCWFPLYPTQSAKSIDVIGILYLQLFSHLFLHTLYFFRYNFYFYENTSQMA